VEELDFGVDTYDLLGMSELEVSEPLSVLGVGVDFVANGVGDNSADDFLFGGLNTLGVSADGGMYLFVEVLELHS